MEQNRKFIPAFGWSFAVASLFSAVLVPLKESSAAVMAWITALTGHHWITHGVLTLVIFVVLGLILTAVFPRPRRASSADTMTWVVIGAAVLSGLIVIGFFLMGG